MPDKTTHAYKTAGTLEIELDVYRRAVTVRQPAILWLHGGALIMGVAGEPSVPGFVRSAAGRGLCDRFPPITGWPPETQMAEIVEDVEDAYGWVVRRGPELLGIDPARIAVMGMSAGGYLTLTAGFRAEPKPKALVAFYGYGDLTGPWYTQPSEFYRARYDIVSRGKGYAAVQGPAISGASSDVTMRGRPDFYLYCRQNGLWPQLVCEHDPVADAAWFAGYEPLRNVTPAYPPTLFLHGEEDTDVPFEQSVLMAEALKQAGVPHELVSNPEWGHAFDHAADSPALPAAFDRVVAFLADRLG